MTRPGRAVGYQLLVAASPERAQRVADAERRRRRQAVLDTLREAEQLRQRLRPRSAQMARARALLHARTTRG